MDSIKTPLYAEYYYKISTYPILNSEPSLEAFLGYAPGELSGKSFKTLIAPEFAEEKSAVIVSSLKNTEEIELIIPMLMKTGKCISVLARGRVENGFIRGVFVRCDKVNAILKAEAAQIEEYRAKLSDSEDKVNSLTARAENDSLTKLLNAGTTRRLGEEYLAEGDKALATKIEKEQHFTQPPARYTEATLVKAMEEKGVGRPSTYAATVSTIQDRDYVNKVEKRLVPTALGEVVTQLMMERFNDIIDVEFTANMESQLDRVEDGQRQWKELLGEFYRGFSKELTDAEAALEGVRLKVPDEETDEICEVCGKKMVIKMGRFGKFLACPGWPECTNTKPLVERMPGRCPKCDSGMLKRKSKRGFAYYACERGAECGFMSWDVPTAEDCPVCGKSLFKKSGRGRMKPFCINETCANFLPEDKRGYYKKPSENAEPNGEPPVEEPKKKTSKKKTAAKKSSAKKTTTRKKKGAEE